MDDMVVEHSISTSVYMGSIMASSTEMTTKVEGHPFCLSVMLPITNIIAHSEAYFLKFDLDNTL